MEIVCSELTSQLKNLTKVQVRLQRLSNEFILLKNVGRNARSEHLFGLFKIRQELLKKIKEINEVLHNYIFLVKGAINPYAEMAKEGGVTDARRTAERGDFTINLQEILDQDRKAYERSGCDIWANSLPEKIDDLRLTEEQITNIKARIELGEIPIVMPGRRAQIYGLMQALERLKPKWIKDGKECVVRDSYYWGYIEQLIDVMKNITNALDANNPLHASRLDLLGLNFSYLVSDKIKGLYQLVEATSSLPKKPYICMVSGSSRVEARTTASSLSDQLNELKNIQEENANLNIYVQSIGENLALQNRFTERAEKFAGPQLESLTPLDNVNNGGTYFRFINLPTSDDKGYVCGSWNEGDEQIGFNRGIDSLPDLEGGFRTAVRI